MRTLLVLAITVAAGCAHAPTTRPIGATCSVTQAAISRHADARAAPWSIAQHLAKNFADHRVSWLMRDDQYQRFVVAAHAVRFGRCAAETCYLFAAPAPVIHDAVAHAVATTRRRSARRSACRRRTSTARCA